MTHNGWTNYETWLFWSHMVNDQWWYNEIHRITDEHCDDDVTVSDLADALRDFINDEIYGSVTIKIPILGDIIETVFEAVNWREIAETLIEEKKPELVYSDGYIKEFPPNKSNPQS